MMTGSVASLVLPFLTLGLIVVLGLAVNRYLTKRSL